MRQFKKKTIALILASTITVLGSFATEHFQNSLMSLKFESDANGTVNMTVLTQRNYANDINPVKKDANTYVVTLPDTNSKMDFEPELNGNIESVNIRTMPYTTDRKGYTKITIKTMGNIVLNAKKGLYVQDKNSASPIKTIETSSSTTSYTANNNKNSQNTPNLQKTADSNIVATNKTQISENKIDNNITPSMEVRQTETKTLSQETPSSTKMQTEPMTQTDKILIVLSLLFIIIVSVYFLVKGKNKVAEIIGERGDFDISDVPNVKHESKKKQIQTKINNLDKTYTKPLRMPLNFNSTENTSTTNESVVKPPQNDMIVDLDELFQEQSKLENKDTGEPEEENQALEDFLNGFSFLDEIENNDETIAIDEDLYQKCITNQNITFSESDVEKIQKLLNSEISDETLNNLSKYLVTNPIKPEKSSTQNKLENLAISYTMNQNITFSSEDIKALDKLVNVEIDPNFITDLKINPKRQEQVQEEIQKQNVGAHRTSEILTLKVRDMLPDLSEALKNKSTRDIKYEGKNEVFYYSEGYDVQTLSVKDDLPDLSIEINNKTEIHSVTPFEDIQFADSNYQGDVIYVSDILPDINDALAHPEKYNENKNKKEEVDENSLLNSISNVSFKPFYENWENAEVIQELGCDNEKIQNETLSEIKGTQTEENNSNESLLNDEHNSINGAEVFDLQENFVDITVKDETIIDNSNADNVELPSEQDVSVVETEIKEPLAQNTLENNVIKQDNKSCETQKNTVDTYPKRCRVKGEEFDIISTAKLTTLNGCYLAKNKNGYAVLGYTGHRVFKIKSYEKLSTEKMQARITEKINDETSRCIVRVGINKFVLNVSDDSLEYVMDLC